MAYFTANSTKYLIFLGLLVILLSGCSAHIRPKSAFNWPEMADSKISGKLAIYISPEVTGKVAKSNPASKYHHNNLMIGAAAAKLTEQACQSVFQNVVIIKQLPVNADLKAAGFRGVLKLDSIIAEIVMPSDSIQGDSISYTDMSIRLGLNYSTEDFLIDQVLPPSFGPDGQYGKKISSKDIKNLNTPLKEITNRILIESGKILAQSLVNIYGARQ
jgi:hypothetical protein